MSLKDVFNAAALDQSGSVGTGLSPAAIDAIKNFGGVRAPMNNPVSNAGPAAIASHEDFRLKTRVAAPPVAKWRK